MTDLTWALSSCVLILAVAAIRALFGARMRPGLRYALWGLVLLRLLVPVQLFTAPWGVAAELPDRMTEQDIYMLPLEAADASVPNQVFDGAATPQEHVEIRDPYAGNSFGYSKPLANGTTFVRYAAKVSVADILYTVWLVGAGVMATVFLISNLRFYTQLRKRRKPLDTDCPLRVYAVDGLASSCLFGNAVYVAAGTDETQLRHVLAHERSHHRHGDHIWALLRCAALALHWYNPLVWWAAALARQDSELCADAGALKQLGEDEREAYGATLIELSARRAARASLLRAATAMSNGKKSLRERVAMIARRPKMTVAVVLAVLCIAAVAAGCAFAGAKPREEAVSAAPETCAGVDAYLDAVRAAMTTASYYAADGSGEKTANVTDTRVAFCDKLAELSDLSPDGTLELYDYLIETKLDVPADSIALAGGMYATEDGWCDLEGQGGHSLVVLRRADGGVDALFDRPNNDDRGGLYYYEESAEEMLYDFYVKRYRPDLPPCTVELPVSANGNNIPARRWDGEGWYVYIPVQAWREASSGGTARWVSGYGTGSELSVEWLASRDESELARRSRPQNADTDRYSYDDGSLHTDVWLYDAPDGGCWQLLTRYDTAILIRSDMAGLEPTVLEAMAASFTLDPKAPDAGDRLRALLNEIALAEIRLRFYDNQALQGEAGGASALMAADYLAALSDIAWEAAEPMTEDERARDWRIELDAPDLRLTSYQDARRLCVEADGGAFWLAARLMPDRQYSWLPYATLTDWYLDARTAERFQGSGVPLTGEELKAWREELATMRDEALNPVSCFFTSTYSDPRDLDLAAFLAYCPLGETVSDDWGTIRDDAERAAVTASGNYPGDFVPTHRYRVSDIDGALTRYARITLDELATDWRHDGRMLYLPEYDAFYNFTSDFAAGVFEPRYGERYGDEVTLWSDGAVLRLRLTGEGYRILSHLPIE